MLFLGQASEKELKAGHCKEYLMLGSQAKQKRFHSNKGCKRIFKRNRFRYLRLLSFGLSVA